MHSDSAFTAPILIRARALSGFAELVQRLGGDPSALLRSVELSPTQLENSESCISLASVARLLDGTAKALKITDFGLQLAEQQDISVLGAVALIAQYAATVSEASATRAKAQRQLDTPAIQADSGMPMTEATDQPRKTKVIARPRCSGLTISPTLAAACGVKMAGEITVSTRNGSNTA